MKYLEEKEFGEYQCIIGKKHSAGESYYDAEERMRELEKDVKREMLGKQIGRLPTKQELEQLTSL